MIVEFKAIFYYFQTRITQNEQEERVDNHVRFRRQVGLDLDHLRREVVADGPGDGQVRQGLL